MNLTTLAKKSVSSLTAALTCILLLFTSAGCRSTAGGGYFASVEIKNSTVEKIAATTVKVFAEDGYKGGWSGSGQMIFEKLASGATSVSREGVVGATYGAQTINRVRVGIEPYGSGNHILHCKAFMVSGGNDPFFQDEVPLVGLRRGPYQALLNKVAKQMN